MHKVLSILATQVKDVLGTSISGFAELTYFPVRVVHNDLSLNVVHHLPLLLEANVYDGTDKGLSNEQPFLIA